MSNVATVKTLGSLLLWLLQSELMWTRTAITTNTKPIKIFASRMNMCRIDTKGSALFHVTIPPMVPSVQTALPLQMVEMLTFLPASASP